MNESCTILALEGSAAVSSAAPRAADGSTAAAAWREPRRGNTMLSQIEALMREARRDIAELSAISVGLGPGNYSGLRVSFTIAQALALPHAIPVYGYSSAAVILEQFINDGFKGDKVAVFGDARRDRSWVVTYRRDNHRQQWQPEKELTLVPDGNLPEIIGNSTPAIAPDWEQRSAESAKALSAILPGIVRRSIIPEAKTLTEMTYRDIAAGTTPPAGKPLYMHPAVFVAPKFAPQRN